MILLFITTVTVGILLTFIPLFPLNGTFRYRHWAGFDRYTHPYGLAAICVFGKQSGSPCHCDLFSLRIGTPST